MRYWIFLSMILVSLSTMGQIGRNHKPKIIGQQPVSINEDTPITIQLTDLIVTDRDDWFYPFGFTLHVYEGNNYTLSNSTITPAVNFNGTLSVKVSVNDGKDESNKYDLQIQVRPVNDPPVISGQQSISTNEDQTFTFQLSNLIITDPDDNEFTFSLSNGSNYTLSGQTIIPVLNFYGTLSISVQVNDGEATSPAYVLQLTVTPVNDAPQITGQLPIETDENRPITIPLSILTVTDPDDVFPTDFTLVIQPSSNNSYMVSGTQVTPAINFEGMLSVPVQVNDGSDLSNSFTLQIKVNPGNNAPIITEQTLITIKEDESFTLQFSHLIVTDTDNSYPNGFILHVLPGTNYTASTLTVTPSPDYFGKLIVNVSVNDGFSESNIFPLLITVLPVNDAPKIINLETDAVAYEPGKGAVSITQLLDISDVDNDSVQQAEVGFMPNNYLIGVDELIPDNNSKIKGSFDAKRGSILFTGKAPKSDYIKAIRSVRYDFTAAGDLPFETKALYFLANDGKLASEKSVREIKLPKALAVNLDIPSAFTPNGDHANDTWSIKQLKPSDTIKDAHVRVYNRLGELLFEAVGFEKEWDGRFRGDLLPADVYFYTIDLNQRYAQTSVKGIVAILR